MTSGSFSSWTEAGNLGFSILSHFIPTFDYATQTIYLDQSSNPPPLLPNLSGLGVEKNGPDAFDVVSVRPGSAGALAGIVSGDRILAINGVPAKKFSWADFRDLVTAPRILSLRIQSASGIRTVMLRLLRPTSS
jgi:membrane-associated protease RseP (regulator of RpoE activity)